MRDNPIDLKPGKPSNYHKPHFVNSNTEREAMGGSQREQMPHYHGRGALPDKKPSGAEQHHYSREEGHVHGPKRTREYNPTAGVPVRTVKTSQ